MGQDYPFTDPSLGANPPIYPSSLRFHWCQENCPQTSFPKDIKIFFFTIRSQLILYIRVFELPLFGKSEVSGSTGRCPISEKVQNPDGQLKKDGLGKTSTIHPWYS